MPPTMGPGDFPYCWEGNFACIDAVLFKYHFGVGTHAQLIEDGDDARVYELSAPEGRIEARIG
jgi:hypothetical protein